MLALSALVTLLAITSPESPETPPVQRPKGMQRASPTEPELAPEPSRPRAPFEEGRRPEPETPPAEETAPPPDPAATPPEATAPPEPAAPPEATPPPPEPGTPPEEPAERPPESALFERAPRTIPPPTPPESLPRPRGSGRGLLIGGAAVGASALLQQGGVYVAVKEYCTGTVEDAQVTGTQVAFVDCMMDSPGGIVLRSTSAVSLGAAIGLIAAGSVRLGRWHAHDDVPDGVLRNARPRVAAGAALFAAGAIAWVTTRVLVRTHRIGCDTQRCAVVADMLTLDASAALVATGAGLLGHGIAYRNRHRRLAGTTVAISPVLTPGSLELTVAARF